MKYEGNVKELEMIVARLEDEKISLDESLNLYAKGIKLAKESLEELNAFQGKMALLNKELDALAVDEEENE